MRNSQGMIHAELVTDLIQEALEIVKILSKTVTTTRRSLEQK